MDPLTDEYPYYTPYQYAGNEPIANVDMDGLEPSGVLTQVGSSSFVFTKGASKTAQLATKVGLSLGTVLKSSIKATLSFINSVVIGGPEFSKGVAEGVGQWGIGIVKSSINDQLLYYNLLTKPLKTISQIKESLSSEVSSLLNEGDKIANGDFSSAVSELNNFAKKSTREHGNFAGKVGAEAAVAVLTGGGGTAGKVAADRGSSTIFRAMSHAEVGDVANFGFRMKAGGYEIGKLFAPTLKEATQFGRYNFGLDGIPNTIMKVKVPNSVLNRATKFRADGMNAISIPANQLKFLKGTPLNYSPLIR